jgi:hypothetical protein
MNVILDDRDGKEDINLAKKSRTIHHGKSVPRRQKSGHCPDGQV